MNLQTPPSPASTVSNDWPGPPRSRNYNQPPFAGNQGRRNLATPPTSGSSFGTTGNMSNGVNGRPDDYRRRPSPPNSITTRSSNSSSQNDTQRRKQSVMEESLYQHYRVLKRYLASTQRDEAAEGKPNRARDKLVRLSPIQFQELSTDVYDELQRRQAWVAQQQNPNNPDAPEFLLPRQGFHPKRNQARQKLSTLPSARFRALATDVFYELERRVPRFAGGDAGRGGSPANSMRGPPSRSGTPNGMRPGSREQLRRPGPRNGSLGGQMMNGGSYGTDGSNGPLQKSSQSNTIVPNKSYLVEDDDDADGESLYGISKRNTNNTTRSFAGNEKVVAQYEERIENMQEKIDDLEKQVEVRNATIETLEQDHQSRDREASEATEGFSTLRMDLEAKLAEALALNDGLKSEIDKAKDLHTEKEQNLRDQLDMMASRSGEDDQWKSKHNDLVQENEQLQRENQELQQDSQELQQELLEQQRVTDEVRREAAGFLDEMKVLARQGDGSYEKAEKLTQQVRSLEDQVAMWKTRLAESKAGTRSTALNLAVSQSKVENDAALLQANGVIRDVHVIEFQIAIDEAIQISRQDPKSLLNQMKSVVLTVKHITDDFDRAGNSNPKNAQLVTRIAGTACNFITATKNFVRSSGLSPVSLFDAAASHVSGAIVEAVHQVKMYPNEAATEPYPEYSLKPNKYVNGDARSSMTESIYSSKSAPRASDYQDAINGHSPPVNGTNGATPSGKPVNGASRQLSPEQRELLANLKDTLEDQTSSLSETIQSLVVSIRSSAEPQTVRANISSINSSVTAALRATSSALDSAASPQLREAIGPTVRSLASNKARLLEAEDEGWGAEDFETWKEVANGLPPLAFEIARQVRDLVSKVEKLAGGQAVSAVGDADDFS